MQQVTITSVTANTPVEIYYCDSTSGSCVYVSTVSVFPYTFDVPAPYSETSFVVKIVDTQSCVDGIVIAITPTPTNTQTSTPGITPSNTTTNTPTPTNTPTYTPTNTSTPSLTSTNTPTPTSTPVIASHAIGNLISASSANTCSDTMTLTNYYTYIAQANLVPVTGVVVYQTVANGTLYNPYNGGDRYIKMGWGINFYVVKINAQGEIVEYQICP
jgi:cell division septation protein DedD